MKIKSVRAGAYHNPLALTSESTWGGDTETTNPLSRYREYAGHAPRFKNPWPQCVCVVTAEDGTWGVGMTSHAGPVMSVINDAFAPLLVGESVFATERLWNMLVRFAAARMGAAGLASYAISAVDLALWDLKGKILQRPVYELLGGPAREEIHCYATGLDLEWHIELGFEASKLCTLHGPSEGTAGLEANEAMVAAARDMAGPDFDLMMDLWPVHDAPYAIELGHRLRPYDLRWLEDYLHPESFDGYPHVRERLPEQTLAAGERWYTDRPFHLAAKGQWVDIVQPDVQWVGGATAVMKIAAIAEAGGLEIALHAGCCDSYGQHLCFALPGNRWGEFLLLGSRHDELRSGYRDTPGMSLPDKGKLVPNTAPGFGLEFTLAMLEEGQL